MNKEAVKNQTKRGFGGDVAYISGNQRFIINWNALNSAILPVSLL